MNNISDLMNRATEIDNTALKIMNLLRNSAVDNTSHALDLLKDLRIELALYNYSVHLETGMQKGLKEIFEAEVKSLQEDKTDQKVLAP